MPSYEFTGPDPIEHFWAGRIEPGDVVEFDGEPDPAGAWKPTKKKPTAAARGDSRDPVTAEPDSDTPDIPEEA